MRLSLLVKGEEDERRLEDLERPKDVVCVCSRYLSSDDLYCVDCEIEGFSIDAAKELASFRDEICDINCRLLEDDASGRFERDLYVDICSFERRLRKLITLCACAVEKQPRRRLSREA